MHTDRMKTGISILSALCLGKGSVAAQESFPAYLPADSTPATVIWATAGHNSIVSRRNMSKTGEAFIKGIDYYDSFGRMEENTTTAYEQSENDIVTYHELDNFGRVLNKWLPVPVSQAAGAFVNKASCSSAATSIYNDTAPFSNWSYEASPLSRITGETRPGAAWRLAGKTVSTSYLTNNNGVDSLRCMKYSMGYVPFSNVVVNLNGYYEPGSLSVKVETDEDGHVTLTFTDRCGRMLLVRKPIGDGGVRTYLDTYYVYDQRDRLCAVLPPAIPKQAGFVLTQLMSKYAYQYQYDRKGRIAAKKLPGVGWTYMAYDDADRVVLSQDREMYAKGESVFYAYDIMGRECVRGLHHGNVSTGLANTGVSGIVLCRYTGTGNMMGYNLNGMSLSNPELLQAMFYDSHSFIGNNSTLGYSPNPQYDARGGSSRGYQTGMVTARLSSLGVGAYDTIAFYHDIRGRVIQSRETNVMGGYDINMLSLGLNGEVLAKRHDHTAIGWTSITETTSCAYDGWGRLLTTTHSINGSTPVTLASYTYDAVGRVSSKTVGGMETTSYSYNIQSWPTKISGQRFTERLCYNAAVEGLAPGLAHQYRWNGTVAAYAWLSGGETLQRGYSLLYDGLDRLTTANYGEGPSLESYHTKYDEKAEYDCMGNPTWIYRRSPDIINDIRPSSPSDRLRLEYDGNQLVHVTDSVTSGHDYAGAFHFEDGADETVEYEYDGNGNMTKDLNRNITEIRYNLLNLPSMIAFGDNTYIYYTYSATGEKLTTRYAVRFLPMLAPGGGDPSSTEAESSGGMGDDISGSGTRVLPSVNPSGDMTKNYCGNVVYDSGERMLLTDEGYVTFAADGTPQYHYYLKDHLGNVRVVMGQAGAVEQVNHYYAFGSLMRESTSPGVQPYKYGGKELDRYSGLDAYDFGARAYFSDRMQWGTMDPLCEKYYDISPYVYCLDNPVKYFDPDGLSTWVKDEGNGMYKVVGGNLYDNDLNIYVYVVDKNDNPIIRGKSIGKTPLISSFFNSDANKGQGGWVKGSIIDINDMSGINFIQDVKVSNVSLLTYIANAFNDHKYDFKATNGTDEKIYKKIKDYYRGMPLKKGKGEILYASARDIGNMMAGYKAGVSGLKWEDVSFAFDLYQSFKSHTLKTEGFSTRNAEKYGFMIGHHNMPFHGKKEFINIFVLISSLFGY